MEHCAAGRLLSICLANGDVTLRFDEKSNNFYQNMFNTEFQSRTESVHALDKLEAMY